MTMDPERWRQISQVAADAIEREGAPRAAYLDHACEGDAELRAEVERILRGHRGYDPLLDGMGGTQGPGTIAPRRLDTSNDPTAPMTPDTADRERRRLGRSVVFAARLPAELLERGARRLALLVLVYAIGFLVAYVVREVTVHGVGGAPYVQRTHTPGQILVVTFMLVSLLVSRVAARRRLPPARAVQLGLVFEVVGSLGIALASYPSIWELGHAAWGVSWLCVWIMMFPLVIPAPPRSAALAAFASASMGPLAIAIWAATRSFSWPPAYVVLATTVPNFVCAVLAWFGSQYVHRIGLELKAARRLGRYRLVAPLGSGGMGEVWIAEHDMLARPAALKLVRRDLLDRGAGSAETLERFEREAQAIAALTSPHTVRLYDFGLTDDEVFYYVMELLEGLDLDRIVRQFGPVPQARAVHFMRHACASLAEAHEAGLIHRDIKPSNLFVCRQGLDLDFVKVLDFGIAAPRPNPDSETATTHDPLGSRMAVLGTPGFMAPEAIFGAAEIRSDLYALGCVGYWLVTGHHVFESKNAKDATERHRIERPAPPSRRTEHPLSAEFDALILDCLEKDPARRPRDASALASRLANLPGGSWTQEQARAWWHEHQRPTAPTP